MATAISRYLKYISVLVLIFAILYNYEIPQDESSPNSATWLLTKSATIHQHRNQVYRVITSIDKYPSWYPNVVRVEHVQLVPSRVHNQEGEKYLLFSRLPLIGEISSSLIIDTEDRPKRFVYSVNSWLLETNTIELKENSEQFNSTRIEWTVRTKRRSILFQYLILPFAKFYKNQLVREALFTLIMQSRDH